MVLRLTGAESNAHLHRGSPRTWGMHSRIVAIVLSSLLVAVGVLACSENGGPAGDQADQPPHIRLYLAGLGEIFVVDVESGRAERIEFPALVGGDPPNLIEARGDGFVIWSGSRTLFSRFDLESPPRSIGESLFFVAAAEPDGLWLVGGPAGEMHLGPTREVDISGDAVVEAARPPAGFPAAAVPEGLAFENDGRLAIWDAGSDEVVERIPTRGGLAGAAGDETISLCDYERGPELRLASIASGEILPVDTPANVAGVDCRAGEISPDGTMLAAPVVISDRPLAWPAVSRAPVALGIADLRTRRLTVVPGTRVPKDYRYARWSPDGSAAFILGRGLDGPREGEVDNRIVEYSVASDSTREIDVDLGAFYDVLTTEAAGRLPKASYAGSPSAASR